MLRGGLRLRRDRQHYLHRHVSRVQRTHGNHLFERETKREKNLDQIEFKDFTPELIGVNGDKVYMKATYDPHHKTTGKSAGPQADMQEWTVKDGKVTEAKFFWGNEKAMNDIFIA